LGPRSTTVRTGTLDYRTERDAFGDTLEDVSRLVTKEQAELATDGYM